MSIIQDALKKVGPEVKKHEVASVETTAPKSFERAKPAKAITARRDADINQSSKIAYFVIIAVLIIILAGIVIKVSRASVGQIKRIVPILPKVESAGQIREKRPVENRGNIADLGGFVLDGIMYIADSPRAIINNIIVGEGETVSGANVEKIKKDSVVLKYNESEVTLKLNR